MATLWHTQRYADMKERKKDARLLLALCLPLMHMCQQEPTLRERIDPMCEGAIWEGIDVFKAFSKHPYEFYRITGETIGTFTEMLTSVGIAIRGTRVDGLSPKNKLLMTLMWLRSYPTYPLLALTFGVSISTVSRVVNKGWRVLWHQYHLDIVWPTVEEWENMRNDWEELEGVVGCIDGTSHEIAIPGVEPQRLFYSGHRKYHCLHTQVIIDNSHKIRYIHSGFLGHMNDAQTFALLPDICPIGPLHFPANCWLLADSIYPCRHPLITSFKINQIENQPNCVQQERKAFNSVHRSRRVYVEILIGYFKVFRVIATLYRHPREQLARLVELCAALAQRRVSLFETI